MEFYDIRAISVLKEVWFRKGRDRLLENEKKSQSERVPSKRTGVQHLGQKNNNNGREYFLGKKVISRNRVDN